MSKINYTCQICGLDGFENQDDLDIHLDDCVDMTQEDSMHLDDDAWMDPEHSLY